TSKIVRRNRAPTALQSRPARRAALHFHWHQARARSRFDDRRGGRDFRFGIGPGPHTARRRKHLPNGQDVHSGGDPRLDRRCDRRDPGAHRAQVRPKVWTAMTPAASDRLSRTQIILLRIGSVSLLLLAWEIIGLFVSPLFLSPLHETIIALWTLTADGTLLK